MTGSTIKAEGLAKSYNISKTKQNYNSLYERLADNFKSSFSRKRDPDSGNNRAFWALKDVSFEIKAGEVVGIIGKNGAGKSTLLKILSRIVVPTCGQAQIFGRVGSLLEVGTGFHPELTGRENIFLNGAIIGMKKSEIRRRFAEIVDFAEIGKFLDVPVKRYSSGMYVRLAFAVAAHLEPEILLVDEVLAVGDAAFQKKCLDKMAETAREGRTVLFISHNMVAVNSLCKRVIWVDGGEVIADGASPEIVTKYLGKSLTGVEAAEEVWEDMAGAPGNEVVRLHRVCVRHSDADQTASFTMQTPFQIEVEFWNLLPNAHLHITLHFYTAEHIIAFTTGSLNTQPLAKGLFRSVCYVPGNLLNSGLHRVVVLVVKDTNSVIFSHASRVPINILDLEVRQGIHFGREPGVVQPRLEWKSEYLNECPEQGCSQ